MQSKTPKIKNPQRALSDLEWQCSRMERCSFDARRSLFRWGITDAETQRAIIEKLKSGKFIDERRYAAAYIRDKLITGRWGEAKIRAGLRAKSINSETIEAALADNINQDELNKKLLQNIEKQYLKEKSKGTDKYNLRAKLFRRAASQGFDIEDINRIINKVIDEI